MQLEWSKSVWKLKEYLESNIVLGVIEDLKIAKCLLLQLNWLQLEEYHENN